VPRLIDIAELDGITDPELATVGRVLPRQHAKKCRLAGPVRAYYSDDTTGRQAEIESLDQQPVANGFGDVLRFDHQIAHPRPRRPHDLGRLRGFFPTLSDERLVSGKPRLAFCLARPRALPYPFKLPFEGPLAGGFLPTLLLEPLLFLLEPSRVVAF